MLDFETVEPNTLGLLNRICQIPELDSFGMVGARNPEGFAIIEISKGL